VDVPAPRHLHAYKWVLTNAAISDDDARGEDVEDVAS
jgi:hypothetical protein